MSPWELWVPPLRQPRRATSFTSIISARSWPWPAAKHPSCLLLTPLFCGVGRKQKQGKKTRGTRQWQVNRKSKNSVQIQQNPLLPIRGRCSPPPRQADTQSPLMAARKTNTLNLKVPFSSYPELFCLSTPMMGWDEIGWDIPLVRQTLLSCVSSQSLAHSQPSSLCGAG